MDANITSIRKMPHNAKDETVVLVDTSKVDDQKRCSSVTQELLALNSDEATKPHNTAIISSHAQYLIPHEQKICMTLGDDFDTQMTYEEEKDMCFALSLLMRYIIGVICQNYKRFSAELKKNIDFVIKDEMTNRLPLIQSMTSYSVMVAVICMMYNYLNVTIDKHETGDFLFNMFWESAEAVEDSGDAIADEFGKNLNAKMKNGEIKITLHSKEMDFVSGEPQVIIKDDLVMLEESTITNVILPEMKTTESVYHLTEALSKSDLLHATKKNRYPCTMYHKGESLRVALIAVKFQEILNQDVQLDIQAKACEDGSAKEFIYCYSPKNRTVCDCVRYKRLFYQRGDYQ